MANTFILYVPVVPNGKNKILYFIESNFDLDGTGHGNVFVND